LPIEVHTVGGEVVVAVDDVDVVDGLSERRRNL
jgi:hypothetical protein